MPVFAATSADMVLGLLIGLAFLPAGVYLYRRRDDPRAQRDAGKGATVGLMGLFFSGRPLSSKTMVAFAKLCWGMGAFLIVASALVLIVDG